MGFVVECFSIDPDAFDAMLVIEQHAGSCQRFPALFGEKSDQRPQFFSTQRDPHQDIFEWQKLVYIAHLDISCPEIFADSAQVGDKEIDLPTEGAHPTQAGFGDQRAKAAFWRAARQREYKTMGTVLVKNSPVAGYTDGPILQIIAQYP